MNIGENIRRIRTEKKITQKELGEKLGGISQQQIGRWENDKANPKKETIEKIAVALGVDPFSLYSFDMAGDELAKDMPVFNAKFNEVKYRLPPGYTYKWDYEEDSLCLFNPDGDKTPCDIDKLLEIINIASDYYISELEKLRKI